MADWRSFWDGEHAIYVDQRHKTVHYQEIAKGILAHLADVPAGASAVVLDYACGEALEAAEVAGRCARLVLCDGAPSVVAKLAERYAPDPKIAACTPEDLDGVLADGSTDLIVVSSLIQYLSRSDFEALLDRFATKLRPGGRFVLADVISPDAGMVADILALLRNGARHGYFVSALVGLVATAISPYRKIRSELGLATYSSDDILGLLRSHGFTANRHEPNLGLSPHRMTFVAVRP